MFRVIFWVVVGVIALSFFGISLKAIVTSPVGQENFAYLWELTVTFFQWIWSLVWN
jgi:hypothetical protein